MDPVICLVMVVTKSKSDAIDYVAILIMLYTAVIMTGIALYSLILVIMQASWYKKSAFPDIEFKGVQYHGGEWAMFFPDFLFKPWTCFVVGGKGFY